MDKRDLPIACTLTTSELQERSSNLLAAFKSKVLEAKELDGGFAYRFPSDDDSLNELTTLVRLERQCCPFLDFTIRIEAGNGPIWLELTGPEGTKEFVATLFQ